MRALAALSCGWRPTTTRPTLSAGHIEVDSLLLGAWTNGPGASSAPTEESDQPPRSPREPRHRGHPRLPAPGAKVTPLRRPISRGNAAGDRDVTAKTPRPTQLPGLPPSGITPWGSSRSTSPSASRGALSAPCSSVVLAASGYPAPACPRAPAPFLRRPLWQPHREPDHRPGRARGLRRAHRSARSRWERGIEQCPK
jgi:hypothetical protein